MLFIFGEGIGFPPALHFQVGNDVLSSDSRRFIDPRLVKGKEREDDLLEA